jgi:hypothetical protein
MIRYPFGEADFQTLTYAATIEVPVANGLTYCTVALTGACTINLDIDEHLPAGAQLFIRASSDATARTITLGTGLEGPAMAGTISKTKVTQYVYDGSKFVACAAVVQLD